VAQILDEIPEDVKQVDFVSVDIEGAEYEALKCWPFDNIDVSMFIVETNKIDLRFLDMYLLLGGYYKLQLFLNHYRAPPNAGVFLDDLYVKLPLDFVYPETRDPAPAVCTAQPHSFCHHGMPRELKDHPRCPRIWQ